MSTLAWSATRVRTFQDCRRKYHYRYHLAPLARKRGAPPEAVAADKVKDLVGLEAWAGDLVHQVIQRALNRWRGGKPYGEAEATADATRILSHQYRDSRAYWSAQPDEFPYRPTLLDLHYYGDGALDRDRAARLKSTVCDSLRAFFRSELAEQIRLVGASQWLPIDRNAAARLDGLLILVKPDFAFRDGEWLTILDWKTGRSDAFWELVQLTCYALYAAEKWQTDLARIRPLIVHLQPHFYIPETEFTPQSVRDVQTFIRETHGELAELQVEEGIPPAELFPFADDPGRCRWCQFRGLCDGASRCE